MKRTDVDLNIAREVADNATVAIVVEGSNKEDVAKVADIIRTLDIKEDLVKADVASCKAAATLEIKRQPIDMNTSFSFSEDGEAVRVVSGDNKVVSLDKEVEVKYTIGNTARSASINQTIATDTKKDSSYIAENRKPMVKMVIENGVDKRTQTVEQLMGD